MVKWELDLWYELWDRAGSQGLDTWFDPRTMGTEGQTVPPPEGGEPVGEPDGA